MTPFTYSRATDPAAAIREAAQAGAKYLGGGTNLVDLMREGIERPSALVDVTGLDRGIERARGRRPADRRGDQQHRAGRGPPRAQALPDAGARHPGGRVGADPQHGDGRRQPAAAHALPLLLRRRRALQQTRAGRGLRRAGRLQPHARDPRRLRRLRRDPSRPTCAWRSPRSMRRCISRAPTARARCRFEALHRLPGDTPERETELAAGRADHRGRAAAAAVRAALDLSQGARPGELCLRAGLGRRRARVVRWHDPRRAAGAGRRGAQAVARPCGGSGSCAAGGRRRRCSARARRRSSRRRGRSGTTASRSSLPGARSWQCSASSPHSRREASA